MVYQGNKFAMMGLMVGLFKFRKQVLLSKTELVSDLLYVTTNSLSGEAPSFWQFLFK
jgi:hypothetical protein